MIKGISRNQEIPSDVPFKTLAGALGQTDLTERSTYFGENQISDPTGLRKGSLMDGEISCEEVKEDEDDIRRKINQKLIKNKNYFMEFVAKREKHLNTGQNQVPSKNLPFQGSMSLMDKRSRSETPDKMSATEVLFRAHQKLQSRQKESPQKIMEKHQQRMKKAEELRAQIENSKKNWYEKIRLRQQIAKEKWKELLAERKAKLQDKLEQAEERRETEIQNMKQKAKQEIKKIDETNYIVKMTMNNMKLDLDMKMNDTLERRNQILEENKKRMHDRNLKEEAAEKRRQELMKETENKILRQRQKREQAEERRQKLLEEKKRTAQEYQKRMQVLQRKNDLGDKISDVMSFVSNSENIWDFLGTERDWQDLGLSNQDEIIYELLSKDHIQLEKMKLKLDADIINKMIIIDEVSGQVYANKEYLPLVKKKKYYDEELSSEEGGYGYDEELKENDNEIFNSPETRKTHHHHQKSTPKQNKDQISAGFIRKQTDGSSVPASENIDKFDGQDNVSDGSDKDSVAEETTGQLEEERKSNQQENFDSLIDNQMHSIYQDETFNYLLYANRIKMSMKRNILKKTLSEDLTWADFLKNETYQNLNDSNFLNFNNRRSMHSTPERKSEILSEDKEIVADEQPQIGSNSKSAISNKKNKKKKNKKQSSNNQLAQTNNINSSTVQNTSSSSNISEKSRISSVVYPSQTKKTPRNQNTPTYQNSSDLKGSGSSSTIKNQKNSSNQSSTHSLLVQNTMIVNQDIQKEQSHIANPRKSVQLEHDSAKKRQNARMHSSSVQESSQGIQNLGLNVPQESEDRYFETQSNTSMSHTGSQMNQLITNPKPLLPITKVMPKKLSANALKMLFPITQQKLLFKRPGKEGQFGKCKLTLKIEDLLQQKQAQGPSSSFHHQVSFTGVDPLQQENVKASSFVLIHHEQPLDSSIKSQQQEQTDSNLLQNETIKTGGGGSLHSTPSFSKRRESTDTNNSSTPAITNSSSQIQTNQPSLSAPDFQVKDQIIGTPTQQSKLWLLHQKFWEKVQPPSASKESNGAAIQSTNDQMILSYPIKKNTPVQGVAINLGSNQTTENSPSPKKDAKLQNDTLSNQNASSNLNTSQNENINTSSAPLQMNEQGYKEIIVKYLMADNIQYLKTEESQKTIFLEGEEANKLIDYLEQNELSLRYCRLCDLILPDHSNNEAHFAMKSHKKTREDLGIKENEDLQLSMISLQSQPGDIEKELLKEKEKALKRKVKRLKAQMIAQALSHESASYVPGKEATSQNKKRFYILCIDLEKQVVPSIKDYEALEVTLKDIIKILDMRKQADLHLMRKLKFIPILIEICKRISVCHKSEFKHLGKVLEQVINIINIFCGLRQNRNYMLETNRMSALIELLNWCLNRPTQLFYGITFLPQLFHILTLHVKHRAPYECQQMKEMYIEYLISSQITMKIKSKFQIINGPLDLSEMMGQVPLFLLKSANFIEALTSLISSDAKSRPVYEKSQKIAEHVFFVVQNTEIFGIIPMIATILLTINQSFKPSQHSSSSSGNVQKLLPQTILSLAVTSIKIVNNVYRMDYRFAQQIMSDFEIQEQLYHLFNYILFYTIECDDKQEDCKELLHETILLIGYFCLNNEKHQALLCKGESTLLQKLCNLPFSPYFCDKKLKEILFPTLIQASYKNDRSLAIMDQEISIEMLVDFIQMNMKEELPRIVEEEYEQQSMSSVGHDRKSHRSPSLSSTTSSQCSVQIDMASGNSPYLPLYMRFPKKLWKEAITFYSKVLY